MSKTRGRPRNPLVNREPNGRARRQPPLIIPPAALAQRAASLGLDVDTLIRHGAAAITAICLDPGAGTALGRLTWRTRNDGSRERRLGDFGGARPSPWITDEMEAAAEEYRALWVRWYRVVGLPRRHPQSMRLERHGHSAAVDTTSDAAAKRVIARMAEADGILRACPQGRLVAAVIDAVVIDNTLPESLVQGERSAALAALRTGLDALAQALLRGRLRAAARVETEYFPINMEL